MYEYTTLIKTKTILSWEKFLLKDQTVLAVVVDDEEQHPRWHGYSEAMLQLPTTYYTQ